ncbi:MAG: ribosome small subunit-dependent GTPase A [Tissierellia bacterium]|nr:ribosome small subunit-dependent GTPase A [Tissierellia bacterium]
MTGRIIKAIAGDYWVETDEGIIVTKPRGVFRHRGASPVVGDYVDLVDKTITKIHKRKNKLVRPNIANIDCALLVFSLQDPKPDFLILDTMVANVLDQNIEPIVIFNKSDLVEDEYIEEFRDIYRMFRLEFVSTLDEASVEGLLESLEPGLYVLAGPSGAGKSSMINKLTGQQLFEVGQISQRIKRGKHTTRHHELIHLADGVYLADTPGFQTLELNSMEATELREIYPEFQDLEKCRFLDCLHDKEPGCRVKEAYEAGTINKTRYENYLLLLDELRSRKDY